MASFISPAQADHTEPVQEVGQHDDTDRQCGPDFRYQPFSHGQSDLKGVAGVYAHRWFSEPLRSASQWSTGP
jgi:hypothetical protein